MRVGRFSLRRRTRPSASLSSPDDPGDASPPSASPSAEAARAAAVAAAKPLRAMIGAMPDRSRKRPRDVNELAKQLVGEATGEIEPIDPDAGKDAAAVALGRKGGLKGGKARAEKMTPEQRSESGRRAPRSRGPKNPPNSR